MNHKIVEKFRKILSVCGRLTRNISVIAYVRRQFADAGQSTSGGNCIPHGQIISSGKEVAMSAHESDNAGSLSRRGFLQTTAGYAAGALAAGAAGCQSSQKGVLPMNAMLHMGGGDPGKHKPSPDEEPDITAPEGAFALEKFLKTRLHVKEGPDGKMTNQIGFREDGIHGAHLMTDGENPDNPLYMRVVWTGNHRPEFNGPFAYTYVTPHEKKKTRTMPILVDEQPSDLPGSDARVG
ncbi:MAG TPA: twin-arginine translocation signal domain-containing protein, partial [Tepidisphaeraceae bacterium]|nr:twin-arginine translocation signal domain-containing protein [Tepidisphaeraceae bacterium]